MRRLLFVSRFLLRAAGIYLLASYFYPELSSLGLFLVDKQAYYICQELVANPLVKTKGTSFVVYYGIFRMERWAPNGNAFTIPADSHGSKRNRVFLTPKIVKSKYLKVAVVHELGHINKATSDELVADKFAVDLLGDRDLVRKGLLHFGIPEYSERIRVLSE